MGDAGASMKTLVVLDKDDRLLARIKMSVELYVSEKELARLGMSKDIQVTGANSDFRVANDILSVLRFTKHV